MSRPRRWSASRITAVLLAVAAVGLIATESHMRALEAQVAAGVLRLTALGHAHTVGPVVVFPHGQHWIGYTIAASCTAALLIAPFFLIAAGLLASGRIRLRDGLLAVAVVAVIVWLANQLRLLVIGMSMRMWGVKTGYSRSHVLAGGVVSTLGVIIGIAVFMALMLNTRASRHSSTPSQ